MNSNSGGGIPNHNYTATSLLAASNHSTTPSPPHLATINYNGLIGYNATDPFSITSDTQRLYGLPVQIQVSPCRIFRTLLYLPLRPTN